MKLSLVLSRINLLMATVGDNGTPVSANVTIRVKRLGLWGAVLTTRRNVCCNLSSIAVLRRPYTPHPIRTSPLLVIRRFHGTRLDNVHPNRQARGTESNESN